MRKHIALVAALVLLCLAAADKPKHVTDAETLVAGISPEHNLYEHKGCFIKWKGVDGATEYENRTDCSDFLIQLLEHSYGVSTEQFKKWTGHTRPLAEHWHDSIVAAKGFTQIAKLADAKVGDVLAVKYPSGLDDTGHVMLVVGVPESIAAKAPIKPGTQQWNVAIIDSSKSGHGPTDTRAKPDHTFGQGVGKGILRIYTDSKGEIAGYCWSDGAKSKFEAQSGKNMVIGRLDVAKE